MLGNTVDYGDSVKGNKIYKTYIDFSGGQNDTAPPDNLLDSEAAELTNLDIVTRGGLVSRHGTVYDEWFTDAANRIDRIAEIKKTDGTLKRLALINGNLVEKTTNTVLIAAWGDSLDWCQFNDKVYLVGGGRYYVYDGTTCVAVTQVAGDSLLTTIQGCKYVEKRGNIIFAAGNPLYPNVIYYSQIGDPTYFKSGNAQISSLSDDGDIVTGIKEFHGALLIFKTRSIFAWFGSTPDSSTSFIRLEVSTGTKSYRTICNVGNYLFFLGTDGVYALLGTYANIIVTKKVSMSCNTKFATVQNMANYYNNTPCAVFKDGKYYVSFADTAAAANNVIGVFAYETWTPGNTDNPTENEPWSFYAGIGVSEFLYSLDGSLYMGSSTNTKIMKFSDTNADDSGFPIHWNVKFKNYSLGAPIHIKKFKRAWIILKQFDVGETVATVTFNIDYGAYTLADETMDEALKFDFGSFGEQRYGWVDTLTKVFRINRKGKRIQLSLSGNSIDNRIFIYGVAFEFKMKKPSKL